MIPHHLIAPAALGSVLLVACAISQPGLHGPASASPAPSPVQLLPIAPGVASSSINTVIFRHSPLVTFDSTQYAAFYDDQAHVVLAKRSLSGPGSEKWDTTTTALTGNIKDAHNTISLGMDGSGILHMAWDHHGANLNYVQTKAPGSLDLTAKLPMDGQRENQVTYPEFYTLPVKNADGTPRPSDLLFLYRVGSSGNGDLVLKRYRTVAQKWETVAQNLVAGEGRQNAYPEFDVGPDGTLHLGWVWRASPDVATNHDVCYARSTDAGLTWTTSTGKKLSLPITAETAEIAVPVPQKSELINQTTMAGDAAGHPYIASYFRTGDSSIPQYRIIYNDGAAWHTVQVGERKTPFTLAGGGTKRIPISRPLVIVDPAPRATRVIVVVRDAERQDRATLIATDNLTAAAPTWTYTDLTAESWGSWEPSYDPLRWSRDHVLDLFLQKTDQLDGNDAYGRTLPPTMAQVLEYKP